MNIFVEANTLPEAWEEAVVRCWNEGDQIKTQYDRPEDPPSRDCSVLISVKNPMEEPRIHKAFPGGYVDLEKYRQEVVDGVHDHWMNPEDGKWSYTYHQRMFEYPYGKNSIVNQIENVIHQLADAPHTRRAQAITWIPNLDQYDEHAPCLQRMWFRIFDDMLRMNIHIRSNDAFKAAFMNMWAFVDVQRYVAERVSEILGRKIGVGEYNHIADSFHIYGSYFDEFSQKFLSSLQKRTFEERVIRSDSELYQMSIESANAELKLEREEEEKNSDE